MMKLPFKTYSNYNGCRVKDFQVSINGGSNVIFAFNVNSSPKTFCLSFHQFVTLLTYLPTYLPTLPAYNTYIHTYTVHLAYKWNEIVTGGILTTTIKYIKLFKQ